MDEERNSAADEPDYGHLLRACLETVFNERDHSLRAVAIQRLFTDEPILYQPHAVMSGHAAISNVLGELLSQFGPTFRFGALGAALGHHGLGALRWQGEDSGRVILSGMNTTRIVDAKIATLWVMID